MSAPLPKEVYACDGVTDTFAINFPFPSWRQLQAFVTVEATGARRWLIPNLDYKILGTNLKLRNDDFRAPWPTGYTLTIERRTRVRQPSSQDMTPVDFRLRVDQLTEVYQQLSERLERTLFIGTEYPALNWCSSPYSAQFFDSVRGAGVRPPRGYFDPTQIDAINAVGVVMLGGTMITTVVDYSNWPVDKINGGGVTALSGTMRTVLVTYSDWPPDKINMDGVKVLSGTMIAPVVTYVDWPVDKINGGGVVVTAGTLN